MILFYEKTTGKVIGSIEGRVHPELHLNMWVGEKEETDRIVVNWIKAGKDFEPDHPQQDIFRDLDKGILKPKQLSVDLKDKTLHVIG